MPISAKRFMEIAVNAQESGTLEDIADALFHNTSLLLSDLYARKQGSIKIIKYSDGAKLVFELLQKNRERHGWYTSLELTNEEYDDLIGTEFTQKQFDKYAKQSTKD